MKGLRIKRKACYFVRMNQDPICWAYNVQIFINVLSQMIKGGQEKIKVFMDKDTKTLCSE